MHLLKNWYQWKLTQQCASSVCCSIKIPCSTQFTPIACLNDLYKGIIVFSIPLLRVSQWWRQSDHGNVVFSPDLSDNASSCVHSDFPEKKVLISLNFGSICCVNGRPIRFPTNYDQFHWWIIRLELLYPHGRYLWLIVIAFLVNEFGCRQERCLSLISSEDLQSLQLHKLPEFVAKRRAVGLFMVCVPTKLLKTWKKRKYVLSCQCCCRWRRVKINTSSASWCAFHNCC